MERKGCIVWPFFIGLVLLVAGCVGLLEMLQIGLVWPGENETGVGLDPEFTWNATLTQKAASRQAPHFKLWVAPIRGEYGEPVQTQQFSAHWSEPLQAASEYRWKVELYVDESNRVTSEERTFRTQDFFTVQLASTPGEGGNVKAGQSEWDTQLTVQADAGSELELQAQANAGWVFAGWQENGALLSEDNPYVLNVTGNRDIEGLFVPEEYTVQLQSNPPDQGIVVLENGPWGESVERNYAYGEVATARALAEENYHFTGWYEQAAQGTRGQKVSDDNPYAFVVQGDRQLQGGFSIDRYTVTVESSPADLGSVRIDGGEWGDLWSEEFDVGTTVVVEALAVYHAGFLGWYEDGVKVSDEHNYSFTVGKHHHLKAHFGG
ncbi:MAG TPA: InlB B-repeat-containing protein, partial [Thermotogota bacterium]|nr:InlB B-repeat-containing protein [Thermotogota bacterium]